VTIPVVLIFRTVHLPVADVSHSGSRAGPPVPPIASMRGGMRPVDSRPDQLEIDIAEGADRRRPESY
jgi:hypothetical protein